MGKRAERTMTAPMALVADRRDEEGRCGAGGEPGCSNGMCGGIEECEGTHCIPDEDA